MSYVVVTTLDNSSVVHGTFRTRAKAEAMVAKINAAIERQEEKEQAEWQRAYNAEEVTYGSDMAPDPLGHAWVATLRPPRIREAIRFAITGNPEVI